MAGNNYMSDPKNPFFSLEDDVDDETFLKAAPPRTNNHYQSYDNELEQKHKDLLQRKKEIEDRTIKSSERSLSILRDTEEVGTATAEVSFLLFLKAFLSSV